MDEKLVKIWTFYRILPDGHVELYAYTQDKGMAELFEKTRNPKKFIKRKNQVPELYAKLFMHQNKLKMLTTNVLTDGKQSYTFITTYEEDSMLSKRCEEVYDEFLELEKRITQFPFNKKMRNLLDFIIADFRASFSNKEENPYGSFNTFNIFMQLYGDTIF
jgi:hypothetical protein